MAIGSHQSSNKEIKEHWFKLQQLGCVISGRPATIHHCHSGSMSDLGIHRGWAQKPSDWLTIPIAYEYHTGRYGIDNGYGVLTWEKDFGTQVDFLDHVCFELDVNVWAKAGVSRDVIGDPLIYEEIYE